MYALIIAFGLCSPSYGLHRNVTSDISCGFYLVSFLDFQEYLGICFLDNMLLQIYSTTILTNIIKARATALDPERAYQLSRLRLGTPSSHKRCKKALSFLRRNNGRISLSSVAVCHFVQRGGKMGTS